MLAMDVFILISFKVQRPVFGLPSEKGASGADDNRASLDGDHNAQLRA
jgi:hypothetical protein